MSTSPLLLLGMILAGAYVAKLWWNDFRAAQAGRPNPHAFPGATPAPWRALVLGSAGAGVIVIAETFGEMALGVADEQSKITVLFAAYTLMAALIEELIFRGYVVIETRRAAVRGAGFVIASLIFAVLHPFLWTWENAALHWRPDAKAWLSTGAVFASSLWFYAVRFARWNPGRSLLPCFAAHLTKNLAVIAVKAAQGFVVGWW